jgi:colanic acid/amylovoran biosynthesis protein
LGPFRVPINRKIVGYVLSRVFAVVLREDESLPVAEQMGIDPKKIVVASDMAFALKSVVSLERPQSNARGGKRIGSTAKRWIFPGSSNPQQAQRQYEKTLAVTLDALVERHDADIVFLPQVIGPLSDDDRVVQCRVQGLMRHANRSTLLDMDLSPQELVAFITSLDLVVATRFHSAIFTMLAQVPVVAIAYEHKTTGIMRRMGFSEWVVPIDTVDAETLIRMCDDILERQIVVREHLEKAVTIESERAFGSIQVCVDAVKAFQELQSNILKLR